MSLEMFDLFLNYMNSGGLVMWSLLLCALFLWYSLGYRFHTLNRGSRKSIRNLIRKFKSGKRKESKGIMDSAIMDAMNEYYVGAKPRTNRSYMDDVFYSYSVEINRYSRLIKTLVMIAPLIGLLGTVIGMIETFDSLASMSLFSQSGGIAGGISQALFTTQLGLVVAVPGVIMGRLLDRRASTMELELEQIKDILCSEGV
jgi:biopolymer transport protein ExbB